VIECPNLAIMASPATEAFDTVAATTRQFIYEAEADRRW
jgi:hypothetical protein